MRGPPVTRGFELGDHGQYTTDRLFLLTANDERALKSSMFKLGIWLEQHAELYQTTMPRNLSYTLCQRRTHHQWRVAVMAGALNSHDVTPTRAPSEPPKLAFVFTGHPSGEIGAAYAAGALTFDSAMAAAYYRRQAVIELKRAHSELKGSMMAVGASADDLGPMLAEINVEGGPTVVVACENSPSSTTLSGDEEAIDRVAKTF